MVLVTFHHQAARAAGCPKVVGGHAGVASRVRFGDVDDAQAPVIQNSDSAKTAHTGASFAFSSSQHKTLLGVH